MLGKATCCGGGRRFLLEKEGRMCVEGKVARDVEDEKHTLFIINFQVLVDSRFQNSRFQDSRFKGNRFQGNPFQGSRFQGNGFQDNWFQKN